MRLWNRRRNTAEEAPSDPLIDGDRALTEQVVAELARARGLENVSTASLRQLLRGATRLDDPPDPLFEMHQIPRDAFYVVLHGQLQFRHEGSPPWSQAAPFTVGAAELVHGGAVDADVRVAPGPLGAPPLVIRISGETFREQLAADVELQIAVQRRPDVRASVTPLPRVSNVYVLTAGRRLTADLFALAEQGRSAPSAAVDDLLLCRLTDLIGQVIAAHLHDPVVVIHVVPPGGRWPVDRVVRHVWAHEGNEDEVIARETSSMVGVPAGPHPLSSVAPGISVMPLGHAVLVIHRVDPALGLPQPVTVEHRYRELAGDDLAALVTRELEPRRSDDPRVVLVELTAMRAPFSKVPFNVIHLVDSPEAAIGVQTRGAGLVTIVTALLSATPREAPPWPTGTVRLRLEEDFARRLQAASLEDRDWLAAVIALGRHEQARASLERWARAITGRRVGVALGGGGAYGFVHGPLIERLAEVGVPIDMVSGSSMGATIGAYYASAQRQGIARFEETRMQFLRDVMRLGISSSGREFQDVIERGVGVFALDQLEVPFFPVVTDARTGTEWSIRTGSLGRGVRASGSMPPFFPTTYIGDRRFLDGGLVANVPSRVLRDEGAALVIASNAIPDVRRGERSAPRSERRADNSMLLHHRVLDTFRMIPILFGALGDNQSLHADVTYRPMEGGDAFRIMGVRLIDVVAAVTPRSVPAPLRRWLDERARHDTETSNSLDLNRAVNQAKDAWRTLLRNPPARAWIDQAKACVVFETGYALFFLPAQDQLDPSCAGLLAEVAELLKRPAVASITVRCCAPSADLARRRAEAVRRELAARGVEVDHDRVKIEGGAAKAGDEDTADLVGIVWRSPDDAARLAEALRKAENAVHVGKLREDAFLARRREDPDLARMLAIEAASLEQSPATDALLRGTLLLRARVERRIEGRTSALAFCPTHGSLLLAVGEDRGDVSVVDCDTGATIDGEGHHEGKRVRAVAWSPDGKLLASAGEDGSILVHDVGQAASGRAPLRAKAVVGTWLQEGPMFSPRGDRLAGTCPAPPGAASVSAERCVGIWALSATALTVEHAFVHASLVRCVAWDPRGELLAVGQEDGTVTLWSATTGARVQDLPTRHRFAVRCAWHDDPKRGRRLAVAREGVAVVYDVDHPDRSRIVLTGHGAQVVAIAWRDGGRGILTASADHTARLWDAESGGLLMVMRWSEAPLAGASFRPFTPTRSLGELAFTWSEGGDIQVWDPETGELHNTFGEERAAIADAVFNEAGTRFAVGTQSGRTVVWRMVEPMPILRPVPSLEMKAPPIQDVAWWGADKLLVSTFDGDVRAWWPETHLGTGLLWGPKDSDARPGSVGSPIATVAVSPDGQRAIVAQRPDRAPHLFIADASKEVGFSATGRLGLGMDGDLPEHPAWDFAYGLAWSADGRCVSVNYGRSAAIWDVTTGERLLVLHGPKGEPPSIDDEMIRGIAWHPTDGRRFAVARWLPDHGIELWSLDGGEPRALGDASTGFAWMVSWSPDGARLVAGHNDGTARVYDTAGGQVLGTLHHDDAVSVVAWSPDGARLAAGDGKGFVGIWEKGPPRDEETETYRRVSDNVAQASAISALAWSPDGRTLLACGAVTAVWTAEGSEGFAAWHVAATVKGHRAAVRTAAFAGDGLRAATGGDDGDTRVEPIDFATLMESVGARLGRTSMTAEEWQQYLSWAGERRPTWPRPDAAPAAPSEARGSSDP